MRIVLFWVLALLATGRARAQQGYLVTLGGDSLAGSLIYHQAQGALHLVSRQAVQTFALEAVARFAIYDGGARRTRTYRRYDKLDSLAPEGSLRPQARPVFCEALPLAGGGTLLCRLPYTFDAKAYVPLAQGLGAADAPETLSQVERRLHRIARNNTRKYGDAVPIYYLQAGDSLHCLSPVRRVWRFAIRRQTARPLLYTQVAKTTGMAEWVRRQGNPFKRKKRMEAFLQAFCQAEPPEYYRP